MIRDVGEAVGDRMFGAIGRAVGRAQERRDLPVDLLESDEAYLAVFDAPGAAGRDVQVQYEDGAVRVRVDRFRDRRERFEMRFPGRGLTLEGRVELPPGASIDSAGADATLQPNGTLEVRLPRADGDTAVPGSDDTTDDGDDPGDASPSPTDTEV